MPYVYVDDMMLNFNYDGLSESKTTVDPGSVDPRQYGTPSFWDALTFLLDNSLDVQLNPDDPANTLVQIISHMIHPFRKLNLVCALRHHKKPIVVRMMDDTPLCLETRHFVAMVCQDAVAYLDEYCVRTIRSNTTAQVQATAYAFLRAMYECVDKYLWIDIFRISTLHPIVQDIIARVDAMLDEVYRQHATKTAHIQFDRLQRVFSGFPGAPKKRTWDPIIKAQNHRVQTRTWFKDKVGSLPNVQEFLNYKPTKQLPEMHIVFVSKEISQVASRRSWNNSRNVDSPSDPSPSNRGTPSSIYTIKTQRRGVSVSI